MTRPPLPAHASRESPSPPSGGRGKYAVKEAFLTLQGEGVQAGSRAVFLRFAGCNLWSGREQDRATAQCNFCDTDFVGTDGPGGGKFADADTLAAHVEALWSEETERRLVVITGGEPMLQLDQVLIEALHARGFRVAVESNGTIAAVPYIVSWKIFTPSTPSSALARLAGITMAISTSPVRTWSTRALSSCTTRSSTESRYGCSGFQ